MSKPETKTCKHCQSEIPYKAKVCPQCRKKQKGGKLKFIIGAVVIIIVAAMILGGGSGIKLSKDAQNMSKKDFKAACETYDYKELARSAKDMVGNKIKITGQVVQVVSENENIPSEYRMAVTKDEYGLWDDYVYLNYTLKDKERLIEDDIVTIYGEITGEVTYTTVLGGKVTVPEITGVYMKIEQ